MKKTKYLGVYLDEKTNKYVVQTTFTTKDGFRIKKCKRGFDTPRKAELWKMEQMLEYKNKNYVQEKNSSKMLDEAIEEYIKYKSVQVKSSTLYNINASLRKYFYSFFQNIKLKNITTKNISEFYEYFNKQELKSISKNNVLSFLLNFIEWLDLVELIGPSIARKFKLLLQKVPVIEQSQNSFIELNDFKKFIDTFDTSEKTYRLIFNLLFYSGVRVGELLAIQVKDLDFINNTLYINKQAVYEARVLGDLKYEMRYNCYIAPYTKTNTTKTIELPQWLMEYALEYNQIYELTSDDFLFLNNKNNITRYKIRKELNEHLKRANLSKIKIHDFRHSNVTLLYDLGADAKYVQERLGHSNPRTSQDIYNHITKQRHQVNSEIIKKLEQV